MEPISIALGVLAAVLHGTAYLLYNKQTKLGQSDPNPISWSVWALLSLLNAFTFTGMSDWVSALQFMAGSAACVGTFVYVWRIGRFKWPKRGAKEWRVFALGALAGLVWFLFHNAGWANMVVLAGFLVSFQPTFTGVLNDPTKERPRAWVLWTLAFAVTIVNLIVREQSLLSFVTPTVLLAAHASIAILSRRTRQQVFWWSFG